LLVHGGAVDGWIEHIDDQYGAGAEVEDTLQGFGDGEASHVRAELCSVDVVKT
jgi:hypothetical protein